MESKLNFQKKINESEFDTFISFRVLGKRIINITLTEKEIFTKGHKPEKRHGNNFCFNFSLNMYLFTFSFITIAFNLRTYSITVTKLPMDKNIWLQLYLKFVINFKFDFFNFCAASCRNGLYQ